MPQPFDYRLNLPNPTQELLGTLQLAQGAQQLQSKRAATEQAQTAQQTLQTDLTALGANPTPAAIAQLSAKYPQLSENFQRVHSMLSEEQQQARVGQASQVYAALEAGQPEIAQDLLKEQAAAYKNSGMEQEAKATADLAELVRLSPATAKTTAGLMLARAMGPEKFTETFTQLQTEQRAGPKATAELDKMAADLDLTNANKNKVLVETKKLSTEARKATLELEALKQNDMIDPAKKFDQEEKLRKEYTTRTKSFREAQDAYQKIDVSSKDASGAGDIALVTSFMKMLDPGSVVRETEFATARDTAGLLTRLQNAAEKLQTGSFLDDTQRTAFARLAKQYMEAAEKNEKTVRKSLDKVVKNYKLDRENVFPTEEPADGATVEAGGKTYEFPDAESAAAFRKEAGLK